MKIYAYPWVQGSRYNARTGKIMQQHILGGEKKKFKNKNLFNRNGVEDFQKNK